VAGTLPQIVRTIEAPYHELCAPGTGERPLGRRFVDDAKISDHHAIIPTTTPPDRVQLSPDESRIYDLVCRRLLSAWHNDYIAAVTAVITAISNAGQVDRYHTAGTRIQQLGWKALERPSEKKTAARSRGTKESEEDEAVSTLPPDLAVGQPQDVINAQVQKKSTKPPKRLMEGALLTAMETAGKSLEQKELCGGSRRDASRTVAARLRFFLVPH
jgi:DNA topoisomerase-3